MEVYKIMGDALFYKNEYRRAIVCIFHIKYFFINFFFFKNYYKKSLQFISSKKQSNKTIEMEEENKIIQIKFHIGICHIKLGETMSALSMVIK